FDNLIRDNVARSGELLREVAAEREQTDQKLLDMRAEVDQRLAEQRSALEEIAAGLAGLQTNLGTLADRVSRSLDTLPVAGSTPPPGVTATLSGLPDRESARTEAQPGEAAPAPDAPAPASAATERTVSRDLGVPEL